jgi:hypothetical protein
MRHRQRRRAWRVEADMTKRVLMRLDKFLAEILASIDPTLRPP